MDNTMCYYIDRVGRVVFLRVVTLDCGICNMERLRYAIRNKWFKTRRIWREPNEDLTFENDKVPYSWTRSTQCCSWAPESWSRRWTSLKPDRPGGVSVFAEADQSGNDQFHRKIDCRLDPLEVEPRKAWNLKAWARKIAYLWFPSKCCSFGYKHIFSV